MKTSEKDSMDYIHETFDMLLSTFNQKQDEYKGNHVDIFRNFTQGAALQHESVPQTLLGYVNKQIVSLFDAKHVNPDRLLELAFVKEKAKDIAVYMMILIAWLEQHTDQNRGGPIERSNEIKER